MKITNFKLGIGIPLNFPQIPAAFFDSFILMDKPEWIYIRSSVGAIDVMRNQIVESAMQAGCTHLIMMDADQIYERGTIPRLLAHKKDAVGCMVCRRYPPFDPLMLRGDIGHYKMIEDWTPGELVEVDATGTGCIMFDMRVFREIPGPWFKFDQTEDGKPVGEDIGFCSAMRKAGFQIFVDTGCPAGHLSNMVVNEATYRLYKRLKRAEIEAAHADKHGIIETVAQQ